MGREIDGQLSSSVPVMGVSVVVGGRGRFYLLHPRLPSQPAQLDLDGLVHLPGRDDDAVEFLGRPAHGGDDRPRHS